MTHTYSRLKVYSALGLGLVAFGFAPILVRLAPDTPPLMLAGYRTVWAAALLLPYWWLKRNKTSRNLYSGKNHLWLVGSGVCLGLHFTLWIASLYYTSVASASVLVTIHPVILIFAEWLLFKRTFVATTWMGVFLAFAGSVLLGIFDSRVPQGFPDPLFGNMLALSAAAVFVIYFLIGRKVRQQSEWIDYVFPVYSYAALTCVVLVFLTFESPALVFDARGIVVGLALALGPQIAGHGSMNFAVKYISPTLLSTLILIEPVFATVAAWLLFAELPVLQSLLSMLVILAGIGLTWRIKIRKT